MARDKRAVALFEVIQKDKRFGRSAPEASRKPAGDFSPQMAERAADLWRNRNRHRKWWAASAAKIGQSYRALARRINSARLGAGAWLAGGAGRVRIWIARTNGIAPGAAAALVVIGALLLARHWIRPADQSLAIERALAAGPAHPSVLAVNARRPVPAEASAQPAADVIPAPANLASPGQRVVNMHYVLMQSYFEQKTAEEARDFLNQHGIACTIERGVKGWRADFYQVIGLQGFPRPSGAEYLAYRHRIEQLGLEFSPRSRYKRFVPQAIKW